MIGVDMKNLKLLLVAFVLSLPLMASTITVQYATPQYGTAVTLPTGASTYVGPYVLRLNGGTDPFGDPLFENFETPGVCFDYFKHIIIGESWDANIRHLTDFDAPTQTKLLEAEWLIQRFGLLPKTDWAGLHEAIWTIFAPGTFSGATVSNWLSLAQQNYTSVNHLSFTVLEPTNLSSVLPQEYQSSLGMPQPFIIQGNFGYDPPTGTPEPVTIVLVGVGLLLMGRTGRRCTSKI